MRAAAFLSASIITIGLYLLIASALAMSAAWIGIGILVIATAMALGLMATGRAPSVATRA